MTYYGTGCIFHYDDEFPQGSGKGFKESDKPNFTGSYYSYTKVGSMWPLAAGQLQLPCRVAAGIQRWTWWFRDKSCAHSGS